MSAVVAEMIGTPVYDEYVGGGVLVRAITMPKEFSKYPKFHIHVEPALEYDNVDEIKSNKYAHLFSKPTIDTSSWKFNREEANAR